MPGSADVAGNAGGNKSCNNMGVHNSNVCALPGIPFQPERRIVMAAL